MGATDPGGRPRYAPRDLLREGHPRPRASSLGLAWPEQVFLWAFRGGSGAEIGERASTHHAINLWESQDFGLEQVLAGRRRSLSPWPGSLTIVPAGAPVGWTSRAGHGVINLAIAPRLLEEAMGERGAVVLRDRLPVADPALAALCTALCAEAMQPALGHRFLVEALARQVAVLLLRNHGSDRPPPGRSGPRGSLSDEELRRALAFMEAHMQDLTLDALADAAGLPVAEFSRRFRRRVGMPPSRFFAERRLAHARELLAAPALSIAEVAASAGFSDQAHLTRCFRAAFGHTPGDFRAGLGLTRRHRRR